ncbi:MAG: hypothetical protein RIC03_04525 [Cyclobacteriaceae bacterium]
MKRYLIILIVVLAGCSEEDITPTQSNANTVTSFSTFGKWQQERPMITDSEGYLYTILRNIGGGVTFSANLDDEFSIIETSLVKINNRGELIWKVSVPEMTSQQLAIDENDNIYFQTSESFVSGSHTGMDVWFKVNSMGISETIRESRGQTVSKDIRWLTQENTLLSKDGNSFIKKVSANGIIESYDYVTESRKWSLSTGSPNDFFVDTDEDGNVYVAYSYESSNRFIDVTVVKKYNAEGEEVSSFDIPILEGHLGAEVNGIKVFQGAFYLAMRGFFEVRDTRLIAIDGFRNEFISEAHIAKYSTSSGERIWIQKLRTEYKQVDDEFIWDAYLDVLVPSTSITNLIQDSQGNMWFNFENYVRQDLGSTIGISYSFGGFNDFINARNGGGSLTNIVSIQP